MNNFEKFKDKPSAYVFGVWENETDKTQDIVSWLRAEAVEAMPEWFKVGAHVWLTCKGINTKLDRGATVREILNSKTFKIVGDENTYWYTEGIFTSKQIVPARVRPWTLEEADAMIGRYVICVDGVVREITQASSRKMPGYKKSVWIRIDGEDYVDSVSARSCAETLRLESGEPCGTYERA